MDVARSVDVAPFQQGYPNPRPATTRKEEVFVARDYRDVDNRAKQAPQSCLRSFDDLLAYLTKDLTSDLAKVRSLFAWLSAQPVLTMATVSKFTSPSNPEGWLRRIKFERTLYSDFFALLCRGAGIPCVIIEGFTKGAGFEVGQREPLTAQSRWNAVHVQGDWRFVHCPWAFITTDGIANGENMMVERDGEAVREVEIAKKEVKQEVDEFYFLTDAEDFNSFCHAKDSRWQLLNSPWSYDDFLNSPRFAEHYCQSKKWELLTENKGLLVAENGKCQIPFQHPEDASYASLAYNLYINTRLTKKPLPEKLQLSRYVVEESQRGRKTLITRLPQDGVYKIEVAGVLDGQLCGLVEFRIEAVNVKDEPPPFPEGIRQIGPNEAARQAGVVCPPDTGGIVEAKPGEKKSFRFRLVTPPGGTRGLQAQEGERRTFNFQPGQRVLHAQLTHNKKSTEELQHLVTLSQREDSFQVDVQVPGDERLIEYGLSVFQKILHDPAGLPSKEESTSEEFQNLVNYLITRDTSLQFREEKDKVQFRDDLLSSIAAEDVGKFYRLINAVDVNGLDPVLRNKVSRYLLTVNQQRGTKLQNLHKAMQEGSINNLEISLQEFEKYDGSNSEISKQARALLQLLRLLKSDHQETPEELETALTAAYQLRVPRCDSLHTAEQRLVSLHEKRINEVYHQREQSALEDTLRRIDQSCVAGVVKRESVYQMAVDLIEHLKEVKVLTDRVKKLTTQDLAKMAGPKGRAPNPQLHSVLIATFLLLGENEADLWEWEFIQRLLEKRGQAGVGGAMAGVGGAMAGLGGASLTDKRVNLALSHVATCDLDLLQAETPHAALFLKWVQMTAREWKDRAEVRHSSTIFSSPPAP